jgi:hypothetical protein
LIFIFMRAGHPFFRPRMYIIYPAATMGISVLPMSIFRMDRKCQTMGSCGCCVCRESTLFWLSFGCDVLMGSSCCCTLGHLQSFWRYVYKMRDVSVTRLVAISVDALDFGESMRSLFLCILNIFSREWYGSCTFW